MVYKEFHLAIKVTAPIYLHNINKRITMHSYQDNDYAQPNQQLGFSKPFLTKNRGEKELRAAVSII